jgi:subtilisin family serine protease
VARVVGRRLLVVCALALCLGGTATAAVLSTATDPLEPQEWWLTHVGADPAAAPPAGVPITIVDSGTDPTHPEFAGRPNTTFLNDQTTDGPGEYHGTIVASIAAAPENGVGMVGIYPTAALQLFDASPNPNGISDLVAVTGIEAAAAHCPGVINLSFGSATPDPQIYDAILDAVHNGCLVVAAAGNSAEEGSPVEYPASWPHVFTVAATDEQDAVTSFSNLSPANDLAAPGIDMIGAVPLTRNPSGYQLTGLAGTSFAAPIVTAAAAWIWTVRPTLTVSQLAGVLRAGAHDIGPPGFDNASGAGLLNIPASLAAPAPPTDPGEPNDDIDQVKPHQLFQLGEPPLTTTSRPSGRIAATLSAAEDPRDLYRIWVPPHKIVRVTVSSGGRAAARVWGPQTVSVTSETNAARRRDLRGQSIRATTKGFVAYVEVLLTGRSTDASYVLSVKASKR